MWGLTFQSLVENTLMTSSFTKREFCDHKTNYIYICMIGVSMLPVSTIILFHFGIVPKMCYFLFFISLYIFCHFFYFFATSWWWYVYISRFHLSLPVCLEPSFCSQSAGCIYICYICITCCFVPSMLVLSTCIKYITWTLS